MLSTVTKWLNEQDEELGASLIAGLVTGLAVGLVIGLAVGLIEGLIVGEYGLLILPTLIAWFVLSEIMFFVQARYLEKHPYTSLWKVALKKLEALFDVGIIGFNILNIVWLIKHATINWTKLFNIIGESAVIITIGLFVIGMIYGLLKTNQYIANQGKKSPKKKQWRNEKHEKETIATQAREQKNNKRAKKTRR